MRGGACEAQLSGCTGWGVHLHHRKLRKQGGNNDPENLLSVCWSCHRRIHDHPAESYTHGFLVHSWQDPAEVPVRRAA